jgi:hypothetical protein
LKAYNYITTTGDSEYLELIIHALTAAPIGSYHDLDRHLYLLNDLPLILLVTSACIVILFISIKVEFFQEVVRDILPWGLSFKVREEPVVFVDELVLLEVSTEILEVLVVT